MTYHFGALTQQVPVAAGAFGTFLCEVLKLHLWARWDLLELKDGKILQVRECIRCAAREKKPL